MRIFTVVILVFSFSAVSHAKEYIVTDFGAIGDGVTLNSKALQSAIDKAHEDFRPAYVFDDVKRLTIDGGSIFSLSKTQQLILNYTEY
jgi:hypothetical protein